MIHEFTAEFIEIESYHIIKIPIEISEALPSKGMVMIKGSINGCPITAPLEPDGKGSHWLEVDDVLIEETGIHLDQLVTVMIEPTEDWMEPEMPKDIMDELSKAELIGPWHAITVKARWDWLRWIRATKSPDTRRKRIEVMLSKLEKGDKRPCCFDRTRCTITDVSKTGVLLM